LYDIHQRRTKGLPKDRHCQTVFASAVSPSLSLSLSLSLTTLFHDELDKSPLREIQKDCSGEVSAERQKRNEFEDELKGCWTVGNFTA